MENNEKELTPEESLKLISQVIIDTRRDFKHSSFFILLCGWVVLVASLACFFIVRYLESVHQYEYIGLWCGIVWSVSTVTGIAVQMSYLRRINMTRQLKNQFTLIVKAMWYAALVAIALSNFIAWKLGAYPTSIILMIVGMSTFVTGYIIKFKPLIFGAIIFWIFSISSLYISGDYQFLMNVFSIVLGYLVPGYMLKYSKH